jgi:hypothetical protein
MANEPTRLPIVGATRDVALQTLIPDHTSKFPEFIDKVRSRLADGQRAYGDTSFERPVDELIGEVEEELLDVCAWSFIAWTRLQRAKSRLPPIAIHEDM